MDFLNDVIKFDVVNMEVIKLLGLIITMNSHLVKIKQQTLHKNQVA
jgi:hypothetical protein